MRLAPGVAGAVTWDVAAEGCGGSVSSTRVAEVMVDYTISGNGCWVMGVGGWGSGVRHKRPKIANLVY